MFTGLVEAVGELVDRAVTPGGVRLTVASALADELSPGDSLAVSGVCLTVVERRPGRICADVGPETMRVTTLGTVDVGGDGPEETIPDEEGKGGCTVDDSGREQSPAAVEGLVAVVSGPGLASDRNDASSGEPESTAGPHGGPLLDHVEERTADDPRSLRAHDQFTR